ncbi:hypothetical protein FKW77_008020 [Venturia effusa]|uniref:C2H2-type domain-containing protein n=1 Tax=Venturia effusa TaxID=50376 RepID=A0A517LBB0_9PEZI|nr:hypothetical protein FKW77_008020 [Venturia effusa]
MTSRDDSRGPSDAYRRRSPGPYDRAAARRRSRSPPTIDRYQPGDRIDRPSRENFRQRDDGDRRRRGSPQSLTHIDRYVPGQELPVQPLTNPLPNPLSLDYQVGFTWFAEWWRADNYIKEEKERQRTGRRTVRGDKEGREEKGKEREQIQAAYDAYKERLQVQMARSFVLQHKGEEWFKERYDPVTRDAFRQELSEFRRNAYAKWESDLENGVFDEFTLEGIYKSESNGAGGLVEKEEGEAIAANEVLGVADLLPTRGGDLRDEAALQPTLLIKTIAPTVSREKMEAFCREHLGENEGGFRWLSLSDPNPTKKYHRIGWVMLNPAGERMDIDERGDGRDEDADNGEEGEEGAVPEENGTTVTVSVARKALEEINGKTIHDENRGDFTCHVGIHEPPVAPRKKALWDLFSAPERIQRDLELAIRLAGKMDSELGEGFDGVTKVDDRVDELRGKGWLQPPVNAPVSNKAPREPDEIEEGEEGAIDEEEEGSFDDEVDDEELLSKKKRLDLLVEYLRRVYNFCLFCVFESDSVHELSRKCPGGHLRRPRASLTTSAKAAAKASANSQTFPFKKDQSSTETDPSGSPVDEKKFQMKPGSKNYQQLQKAFNWVKTYEDKLLQIIEPEKVDIKKIGGKPIEEGLEEELAKYVKQEDESKFRCKVPECTKLFKGLVFWRKHLEKRHDEFFNKIKQDVALVNSYVLDPAHIAPSRSDANSNGHFPLNNHAPAGTPRGFNLANVPFNMPNPGMGPPNAMHMAAFMAQQGMTPGWVGGLPGDDDRHGSGPRRTNTRFNARPPGPYDRQNKDQRNARWNGGSGRLTPPRGGPRPMINPRFSEGGPGNVGPREAVQGRALKSYEDLDAAGAGNGSAELDY